MAEIDIGIAPTTASEQEPPVQDESPQVANGSPSNGNGAEAANQPPSRRPRRDAEGKARGQRLFGMLNSTLSKFKVENERRSSGEAAKRRASLEARLQEKLRRESQQVEEARRAEQESRADRAAARRLAESLAVGDAEYQTRRAHKRRLAEFLCTSSPLADVQASPRAQPGVHPDRQIAPPTKAPRIAPGLPQALAPISATSARARNYPLYYLPAKLLPSQKAALEAQQSRVDEELRLADEEWEKERARLEVELEQVRARTAARRAGEGADSEMNEATEKAPREDRSESKMEEDPEHRPDDAPAVGEGVSEKRDVKEEKKEGETDVMRV